ncbi:hypothetical protein LTR36_010482 [Oleoguttula mirabilis]|uniref:Uncharacterized protein n=1 Tax=Oleoguttula mirabilis TaxID=1507867 RepID=A0AAV9J4C3_9PEZI|nr:hypothetical protein LTR36_010482 [Oleoguttula mirabilis]
MDRLKQDCAVNAVNFQQKADLLHQQKTAAEEDLSVEQGTTGKLRTLLAQSEIRIHGLEQEVNTHTASRQEQWDAFDKLQTDYLQLQSDHEQVKKANAHLEKANRLANNMLNTERKLLDKKIANLISEQEFGVRSRNAISLLKKQLAAGKGLQEIQRLRFERERRALRNSMLCLRYLAAKRKTKIAELHAQFGEAKTRLEKTLDRCATLDKSLDWVKHGLEQSERAGLDSNGTAGNEHARPMAAASAAQWAAQQKADGKEDTKAKHCPPVTPMSPPPSTRASSKVAPQGPVPPRHPSTSSNYTPGGNPRPPSGPRDHRRDWVDDAHRRPRYDHWAPDHLDHHDRRSSKRSSSPWYEDNEAERRHKKQRRGSGSYGDRGGW